MRAYALRHRTLYTYSRLNAYIYIHIYRYSYACVHTRLQGFSSSDVLPACIPMSILLHNPDLAVAQRMLGLLIPNPRPQLSPKPSFLNPKPLSPKPQSLDPNSLKPKPSNSILRTQGSPGPRNLEPADLGLGSSSLSKA